MGFNMCYSIPALSDMYHDIYMSDSAYHMFMHVHAELSDLRSETNTLLGFLITEYMLECKYAEVPGGSGIKRLPSSEGRCL